MKRKPKPTKDVQLLYFCQTTHNVPRAPISLFVCTDQQQSPPNFQMAKYLFLLCTKCKAKKNTSATEVNCVVVVVLLLLLMCWRDVRAEQQSCTKSFICASKCVRERATDSRFSGSQSNAVGPRVLLPLHALVHSASLSRSLALSHCSIPIWSHSSKDMQGYL